MKRPNSFFGLLATLPLFGGETCVVVEGRAVLLILTSEAVVLPIGEDAYLLVINGVTGSVVDALKAMKKIIFKKTMNDFSFIWIIWKTCLIDGLLYISLKNFSSYGDVTIEYDVLNLDITSFL